MVTGINSVNSVNFRGSCGESTGSIGYLRNKPEQTDTTEVNFRGKDTSDGGKKKKTSLLKYVGGALVLSAATIIGLGYAHKAGAFSKATDGFWKKASDFIEPAAKTCRDWCSSIKKFGLGFLDKFKGNKPA